MPFVRKTRRYLLGACGALLLLAGMAYVMPFDYLGPRPRFQHVLFVSTIALWQHEFTATPWYPNVGGHSAESLALLAQYMGGGKRIEEELSSYAYVPGLKADDPPDLVMLYFKKPTRYSWWNDRPSLSAPKGWLTFGPCCDCDVRKVRSDVRTDLSGWACLESEANFRRRLEATLVYLEANRRSYWMTVKQEHETFLRSSLKSPTLEHRGLTSTTGK